MLAAELDELRQLNDLPVGAVLGPHPDVVDVPGFDLGECSQVFATFLRAERRSRHAVVDEDIVWRNGPAKAGEVRLAVLDLTFDGQCVGEADSGDDRRLTHERRPSRSGPNCCSASEDTLPWPNVGEPRSATARTTAPASAARSA